jgi:hypothetical protein
MIELVSPAEVLSGRQVQRRWILLLALAGAVAGLSLLDPVGVGSWMPFAISCGAITGLPCVLCGLTRALHLLCHGDFERALYFNWLAFPIAASVCAAAAVALIEAVRRRQFVRLHLAASRRVTAFALATLFALWTLQAFLAVHFHKSELLNPRGPLYSVFIR